MVREGDQGYIEGLYKLLFLDKSEETSIVILDEEWIDKIEESFLKLFEGASILPPLGVYPYVSSVPPIDKAKERVETIKKTFLHIPRFVFATLESLLLRTISKDIVTSDPLILKVSQSINVGNVRKVLEGFGYELVNKVRNYGECSFRGGVFEVFPPSYDLPIRVITDFDLVTHIRLFDPEVQRIVRDLEEVEISPPYESNFYLLFRKNNTTISFMELFNNLKVYSLLSKTNLEKEYLELLDAIRRLYSEVEGGKNYITPEEVVSKLPEDIVFPDIHLRIFPTFTSGEMFLPNYAVLSRYLLSKLRESRVVFLSPNEKYTKKAKVVFSKYNIPYVFLGTRDKFNDVLELAGTSEIGGSVGIIEGLNIPRGLEISGLAVLTVRELFNREFVEYPTEEVDISLEESKEIQFFTNIKEGDYVVHARYGIGIFAGIREINYFGNIKEFARIEFDEGDVVYVPPEHFNLLSKYIGSEKPSLGSLRRGNWKDIKKRVRESILKFSRDLLRLKAIRQVQKKTPLRIDFEEYEMLEDSFPYEETPDQLKALDEIKLDLASSKVMDRILCGDVGFGKTEIAIRTAYLHILNGFQVMVLVPTTVLAEQHYKTFSQRLSPFGVRVGVISRLRKEKEILETIEGVANGSVDLLIGTHALIIDDKVISKFKNLGLVVIDEEHKFGVEHKEAILKGRENVDVLMLSATPIPRTLGMGLASLKDISLIATAPVGRKPVKTFIVEWNDEVIREAIEREIKRDGQILVVSDKIEGIEKLKNRIIGCSKGILNEREVCVLHGRLGKTEIENAFFDFVEGKYRVMVATTISESGLDIPNVNTVIVNNAHLFGLADLHQIRGRVGRRDREGYAYFIYPSKYIMSELQMKRLSTIEEHSDLGAGFKIALKDLEFRGAGNLLGKEQHGNIDAVGYVFYIRMLSEVLRMLEEGVDEDEVVDYSDPLVYFRFDRVFPEELGIPDDEKVEIMLKLNIAYTEKQVNFVLNEIKERYGRVPEGVYNLAEVVKFRLYLKKFKVEEVYDSENGIIIRFGKNNLPDVDRFLEIIDKGSWNIEMIPDEADAVILKVDSENLFHKISQVSLFLESVFSQSL
ncbi:MAG: DEAD/DEAH box helicase [Brevinematia bacterium]